MAEKPTNAEQSPGERNYAIVCLMALLSVVILMMFSGMGVWSVIPMLIGGLTFVLGWRAGPPLVLLSFLVLAPTLYLFRAPRSTELEGPYAQSFFSTIIYWAEPGYSGRPRMVLSTALAVEDVLLAIALLIYAASCYRSLALSHSIFPADANRGLPARRAITREPPVPKVTIPRLGETVTSWELPWLFAAIGICVFLGMMTWFGARFLPPSLELSPAIWRNTVFFWVIVGAASLCVALFRYLGRQRAPTEENLLYLQDQLWHETRHEQSTINRWLVWARLRGQRRKEK